MRGTLYVQYKKGKPIKKPEGLECEIDLGRGDHTALAGIGSEVKSIMKRAQVEFISANGLMISGVIEEGFGLKPNLYYQEWWFVPIIHGTAGVTE